MASLAPSTRTAAPPRPGRRRPLTGWSTPTGLSFVVPALAFFVVFIAYPVARTFYLSLTRSDGFGGTYFAGLHNYGVMLTDPTFVQAAVVTVVYTVVTTVLQTGLALGLALLVNAGPRRSAVVYRTLLFLPAAISLTVTGLLWRLGLTPVFGVVNRLLTDVGLGALTHPWLGDTATVLPTIIVVSLWQATGLFMLIFYAALGNIDPAIAESARMDGAGPLREAWSITIPILRPVIEVVVMLNVLNGLKVFDLNFVMANGGPLHASESLSTYTYLLTFGSSTGGVSSFGYGSAISVVVFLVAGVATLLLYRFRKGDA
ncbi:carbohydrate ABC transporter permease [Pseudonocardia xinjiangensis]|uniref:Sugar ABC transporter permease n=1 Tax=Pseudonocardia xinjiangensis TaxID=75289 RepID=A0ABX1RMN8_9PSEU|nr:sugar ABC transporter permease [Pseudonocardia xinjiangensis]NMH80528.1 sugar ABC transporter permease [Pseudonocardia xinjiangensis]